MQPINSGQTPVISHYSQWRYVIMFGVLHIELAALNTAGDIVVLNTKDIASSLVTHIVQNVQKVGK